MRASAQSQPHRTEANSTASPAAKPRELVGSTTDAPTEATYWNPTSRFIGSSTCAKCHGEIAKSFRENTMSHALENADSATLLRGDVDYRGTFNEYSYRISRRGGKLFYAVSRGDDRFEAPIQFIFGQGDAGQTYLFEIDGTPHESRVSYYSRLKGLALTVGAVNTKPADLREAAGRRVDEADAKNCFGCHTTGARIGNTLQLNHYEPGVQCESCHGPGGAHVDSIRNGKPAPGSIRSLKGMNPQQANEFCGTCHRTWETVMKMGLRGINNARFPPYRLTNSPCFSVDDPRISCTACHDPHKPLVHDDAYYDSKCAACHNATVVSVQKRICPVGTKACTSCHMQRVETEEAHHAFADHWFRVVRPKDAYPD